jgi:hypothetical protein
MVLVSCMGVGESWGGQFKVCASLGLLSSK